MKRRTKTTGKQPRHKGKGQSPSSKSNLKRGDGFDSHPDRINKSGRPKKLLSTINDQLAIEGYLKVSNSQIVDVFQYLVNLDKKRLKSLQNDHDAPYVMRLLIQHMDGPDFITIMDRLLDRGFGRSKQIVEAQIREPLRPDNDDPELQKMREELREMMKGAM